VSTVNKGIVMELSDSHIIVLTPQGHFEKIARMNRSCQVGEEIVFDAAVRRKRPVVASVLAAAVLICVFVFAGATLYLSGTQPVVAYVAIDINPSVELGIDAERRVVEARGLDPDGAGLLDGLDYKGKSLEEVTSALIARIDQQGIFDEGGGEIVISTTKVNDQAELDEEAIGQIVSQSVSAQISERYPDRAESIQVATIVTPPAFREEALSHGISAGKYAAYLNAKSNGEAVTLDDLKNESAKRKSKDGEEKSGLGRTNWTKWINPDNPPQKETLSRLLEAEKKGELDQKLKEKSGNNGNGNKNEKTDNDNDKKAGNGKGKKDDDRGRAGVAGQKSGNGNGQTNRDNNPDGKDGKEEARYGKNGDGKGDSPSGRFVRQTWNRDNESGQSEWRNKDGKDDKDNKNNTDDREDNRRSDRDSRSDDDRQRTDSRANSTGDGKGAAKKNGNNLKRDGSRRSN
jgi:hypothetical protein